MDLTQCVFGGACIDPAFGPTNLIRDYWSTTAPSDPSHVWVVNFSNGIANSDLKSGLGTVRAVRNAP